MTAEKSLENRIRGWLPKEPLLTSKQSIDNESHSAYVRLAARSVVVSVVTVALLSILEDVLGLTRGVGVFVWPITVNALVLSSLALFLWIKLKELRVIAKKC